MMGLIGIISLIGIVGCSEDKELLEEREPEALEDKGILEATASAPSYSEVTEASRGTDNRWATDGMTRSTWNPPASYYLFSDSYYSPDGLFYQQRDLSDKAAIDIYLTTVGGVSGYPDFKVLGSEDSEYLHGRLRKNTGDSDTWKLSDIEDLPTGKYYVYGYIPADAAKKATISKLPDEGATYADGAVLTIHELKPIVPADVCVTIGAKEGFRQADEDYDGGYYTDSNNNKKYDEGEPNNLDNKDIGDYNPATHRRYNYLTPGDFSVNIHRVKKDLGVGDPPNESNHLFLLFDHIYSGLRFRFKVQDKYDDLRTIVLKKVELKSDDMYEKYDCTITLKANKTGTSPISSLTFAKTSVTPPETNNVMSYAPIFNGALYDSPEPGYPGGIKLQKDTYTGLMGCFLPHESNIFTLKSTYDVYDKQGNLIRQDCMAENKLNLDRIFENLLVILERGTYYIVNLTVAPTYLYVLSEPDLNNPTIVVN